MSNTLTYQGLKALMDELEPLMPVRSDSLSLVGMPVYVAPEFPKVKLNYKVRTKYGDEFEFLTKEQQAETDAWLLATFGTASAVPEGTAYVMNSMFGQGVHFNPRDVVKLSVI